MGFSVYTRAHFLPILRTDVKNRANNKNTCYDSEKSVLTLIGNLWTAFLLLEDFVFSTEL